MYQVLAANQQASTLRTTHCLTSAESDQVVTHIGVIPKVGQRRRICSSVVHARQLQFFRHTHPLVHLDLSCGVGEICEVHHRRALIHRAAQLISGFDLDELDPSPSQLMVEGIAMRLLNNDFGFQSSQVRQLFDEAVIVAGKNSGKPRLNSASRARSDERGIALRQLQHLRNTFPGCGLKGRNADKMLRGLAHDGLNFGSPE